MKQLLIMIIFSLICSSILMSGELNYSISHNLTDLSFAKYNGYDVIYINQGMIIQPPGAPSLPYIGIQLSIPATSRATSLSIDNEEWIRIGYYNIMPAQQAVPIGEEVIWTPEDSSIYKSNSFYPSDPEIYYNTGNKSGFMIAGIVYSSLRYNPVTGELQLLINATLTVRYEEGLEDIVYLTPNQMNVFGNDVKTLVENPEDVDYYSPMLNSDISGLMEYVIITPNILVNSFAPLIQWKNQKGIRAKIFSKGWVLSNYPAYDDMESIREFVKDLHENHGLIYLVLAGDYDNLGTRFVWLYVSLAYSGFVPSDQYFSDICPYDKNWDANGNHIYGEFRVDSCDWRSDVYVGRFPVNYEEEVTRWVNKVISYEQHPEHGYHERALFAGALLWEDYHQEADYCGDIICDSIADNHIPDFWLSTKMYQLPPCYLEPSGFIDSFNIGYNWCYIASHGEIYRTLWGESQDQGDILSCNQQFLNKMNLGVVHGISCFPGHFDDHDCLAEYIFNSENGGAIAIMMNAREGFGAPPDLGPSERMDLEIATSVFDDNRWNIGRGFGCGKDEIINQVNAIRIYHWCFLEYNLFGDPETEIYSREPEELHAYHDTVIYMGEGALIVNLSSERDPSNGVVCCLFRPNEPEVWFRDTSNAQAVANIYYNITSPGDIILTAYEHDYICYIDTIQVYPRPYWATYKYPYMMDWDLMCEDYGQCDYIMETDNNDYLLSYSDGCAGYVVIDNEGQVLSSGSYLSPAILKKVNCIAEIPEQGYLYGGSYYQLFDEHGVIKIIDSNYNIIGSEDIGPGEITKIIPVSDGGYIAIGILNGNCFMGKFCLMSINNICWRWKNTLSWGDIEGMLYSVIESSDNNYIAVGHRDTGGSCFFRISTEGLIIDSITYGDTLSGGWSGAYDIDEDLYDGSFIIVGKKGDQSGNSTAYIQEVDNSGILEWREEYSDIELLNSVYISYSSLKIISGGVAADPYLEEDVGIVLHADYYNNNNYYITAPFGNMYTPSLYRSDCANIFHTLDDGYIAGGTIYNSISEEMYPVVNKLRYEGQDNSSGGQRTTNNNANNEMQYSFVCRNNVFSEQTSFNLIIPVSTNVKIEIYNIAGQKVTELVNGYFESGQYSVNWNGTEQNGVKLSSGIYFVRFQTEDYEEIKSINIIK